ncbi:unnamed protein product [Rhizoctonia solani]|uniref:Zn(2)-C6 fungal-type domain-containing protein n=1 Tax=Rhizoctonia solani TaxID=456999 RepID=A0A8H3HPA8_9AGAM|nr:unnamed protein product [Rhizoctonia solani]
MAEPRVKKTALACDHCRRRKRKCDGRTPVCTPCELGSFVCGYSTTLEQRRPPQKNYVTALEARIALLEQILKNADTSDTSSSPGPSHFDSDPPHESSDTTPVSSPIATPIIPSLTDDLNFILDPQTDSEQLDLGMAGYETLASLEHEHKLLAQFWDWQRMHLPYVAPVPLLSAYAIHSELAHPGEPVPPPPPPPPTGYPATGLNVPRASAVQRTPDLAHFISPLLLYSMFAIAAVFHGDAETGEMFYQRARSTLFQEAANPRVATVQAVCLMATWELGHARSAASWTLIGVALSLCVRLGMNVDATPLLQSGTISQRLFETRNFVFWAAFNAERFHAICMGMRPLIDRRIISTPKQSSPSADTLESRKANRQECTTWWSPSSLGMGDVLFQAAWDSIRDLIQMMDDLFDSVYATDAPTRTPQDNLELVARNHLTIQKFIDSLPTWLRSTGAIRRKESGLVYLHVLTNRPFLSSYHTPSHTTRQYRTLAFRIARASALQVSSLIRHIPLSSPCVTMPYIVYSACTILLLAPEDPAAMDGVRTCLACLDGMDQTGYWVDSAQDAARRIRALADKWSVGLESPRRVLGLAGAKPGSSPLTGSGISPSTGRGEATENAHVSSRSVPGSTGPDDDVTLPANIGAAIDRALQVAHRTRDVPPRLPSQSIGIPAYDTSQCLSPRYQPSPGRAAEPTGTRSYHPYKRSVKKHVAYAASHADPVHDMHLPHAHWHSIIPPSDNSLPFPPDPSACADVGTCFSYTVEHARDPAFVDRAGDPYAGVPVDWAEAGSSLMRLAGVPAGVWSG